MKWLRRLFRKPRSKATIGSDIDPIADMWQSLEDSKMDSYIRQAAFQRYMDHISAPVYIMGDGERKRFVITMNMRGPNVYTIHSESTARYLHVRMDELIEKEFQALLAKHGDPFLHTAPVACDLQRFRKSVQNDR